MRTHDLPIAESFSEAVEYVADMYQNRIPGFQYASYDVDMLGRSVALFAAIDEGSEIATGNAIPLTRGPSWYMENSQFPPHTDDGFVGVSVHSNRTGSGIVELAHPGKSFQPAVIEEQSGWRHPDRSLVQPNGFRSLEASMSDLVDDLFVGEVFPGSLTVFSQGNVPIEGSVTAPMRPAIHNFEQNRDGERRQYDRYSTSLEVFGEVPQLYLELEGTWFKGNFLDKYRVFGIDIADARFGRIPEPHEYTDRDYFSVTSPLERSVRHAEKEDHWLPMYEGDRHERAAEHFMNILMQQGIEPDTETREAILLQSVL